MSYAIPHISFRQLLFALALVGLAGCDTTKPIEQGRIGYAEGFFGAVVAEEPRAALIGKDTLSAGGTAVDAVTAMYFALSVTKPSTATLGGGGVCVTYQRDKNQVDVLDFTAKASRVPADSAERPSAVPLNPRGFYVLHARQGRLKWAQLLGPAEQLARFDARISRSLATDIAQVGAPLIADPEARRIFARADGSPKGEGEALHQLELAALLSRLRNDGPGPLYNSGPTARALVDAVRAAGGTLSIEDLEAAVPQWRQSLSVTFGYETIHVPPPPAAAGIVTAQMLAMLDELGFASNVGLPGRNPPEARAHALAETSLRAFADRQRWLEQSGVDPSTALSKDHIESLIADYDADRKTPANAITPNLEPRQENPAASGFAAVDGRGNAAACAVTPYNLFGTGRVAPGTGIVLAAAPGQNGRDATSLGPVLAVNHNSKELFFAGAASGGIAAPTALATVAATVLSGTASLEQAISQPRVHNGAAPDVLYHEADLAPDLIVQLIRRGHALVASQPLGSVSAIFCAKGLPSNPNLCAASADPRGYGLGSSANQ